MEQASESDRATARLLYDDSRPQMRPKTSPSRLRLRRPSWLLFPMAFVIAAGLPGLAAGELLGRAVPFERAMVGASAAGFQAASLLLALMLARREQKSLALITPYYLSSVHAFLAIAVTAAFIAGGTLGRAEVLMLIDRVGLQSMDGFGLKLATVYVVTFALFTGTTLVSTLLFRVLGLVREPFARDD